MPTKYRKRTTSRKTKKSGKSSTVKSFKSPFATSFNSGIKSGKPCGQVIQAIAKRTGKNLNTIIKSLTKAGLCTSQKFNGQFVCWPTFSGKKPSAKNSNQCQTTGWQNFIDWCLANKICTPTQLSNNTSSQKTFMKYCQKFFNKQFKGSSAKSGKKRYTSRKKRTVSTSPKTKWSSKHTSKRGRKTRSGTGSSYSFSNYGSKRYGRYSRAA